MFYSTGDRASSFTETGLWHESRFERHSTQPVQTDESADVAGFLAQREPEMHLGVQGNVCVKF